MAKDRKEQSSVRVRGVRRVKVDEQQIALGYVLLAQAILAAEGEDRRQDETDAASHGERR
jgi:hypothetical protein